MGWSDGSFGCGMEIKERLGGDRNVDQGATLKLTIRGDC